MDISFKGVEHRYMIGTPFEKTALHPVDLFIPSGSFTAIIGHTGSGKSTLIQHINGLLKPSAGEIVIGKFKLNADKKNKEPLRDLRQQVGLVFQYPEHQLFEETVAKDICFGPMNYGVTEEAAMRRVRELLPLVGLNEDVLESSPFQLSGGQMRRVAIAGVLAIRPSVLVLDEPTAGLDPEGRVQMLELFNNYHKEYGTTTILVTHSMEDAAKYADHLVVMNNGKIEMSGSRDEVFKESERLSEIGLDLPDTVRLLAQVKKKFNLTEVPLLFEKEEVAAFLADLLHEKGEG
ncbi:energy-coupling factor ABC transporter ATP-binding protein [Alkalihalophilus marmarensis]|uniref:energy-coupling factor ABC transporter ATP-binding protein n=1 Tax=Alkalihalophilus marmarensis TaxID=521377 RepID=UPI002E1AF191|nr:energy-coupling factor ABC transporter ATP-binding protein [Alkalihalophilus marmarensis]MED1600802.1 energy-coupling factor ABC transporter ATP-binding protein [Alkalihalophilus marmarensis]